MQTWLVILMPLTSMPVSQRPASTCGPAGWAETTVIIRFWLLTAITCGLGVALFYGEWLAKIGA